MIATTPSLEEKVSQFLITWTPRAVTVLIGGYYGLGIAYELGLMSAIDSVAMQVIKHFFGYAGLGAMMPTVQWYSAWAVRIAIALGAGVLYDLAERCSICAYTRMRNALNN